MRMKRTRAVVELPEQQPYRTATRRRRLSPPRTALHALSPSRTTKTRTGTVEASVPKLFHTEIHLLPRSQHEDDDRRESAEDQHIRMQLLLLRLASSIDTLERNEKACMDVVDDRDRSRSSRRSSSDGFAEETIQTIAEMDELFKTSRSWLESHRSLIGEWSGTPEWRIYHHLVPRFCALRTTLANSDGSIREMRLGRQVRARTRIVDGLVRLCGLDINARCVECPDTSALTLAIEAGNPTLAQFLVAEFTVVSFQSDQSLPQFHALSSAESSLLALSRRKLDLFVARLITHLRDRKVLLGSDLWRIVLCEYLQWTCDLETDTVRVITGQPSVTLTIARGWQLHPVSRLIGRSIPGSTGNGGASAPRCSWYGRVARLCETDSSAVAPSLRSSSSSCSSSSSPELTKPSSWLVHLTPPIRYWLFMEVRNCHARGDFYLEDEGVNGPYQLNLSRCPEHDATLSHVVSVVYQGDQICGFGELEMIPNGTSTQLALTRVLIHPHRLGGRPVGCECPWHEVLIERKAEERNRGETAAAAAGDVPPTEQHDGIPSPDGSLGYHSTDYDSPTSDVKEPQPAIRIRALIQSSGCLRYLCGECAASRPTLCLGCRTWICKPELVDRGETCMTERDCFGATSFHPTEPLLLCSFCFDRLSSADATDNKGWSTLADIHEQLPMPSEYPPVGRLLNRSQLSATLQLFQPVYGQESPACSTID